MRSEFLNFIPDDLKPNDQTQIFLDVTDGLSEGRSPENSLARC
jgi:hypothetical protein